MQADHSDINITRPCCSTCVSTHVLREARAQWDADHGDWVLGAVFDHAVCEDCGAETHLVWTDAVLPEPREGR
jgi:hypothetical protein